MPITSTWTVILRCFACGGNFTLRHLSLDRVLTLPLITPCPHCAARPAITVRRESNQHRSVHKIFDLREESEATFRKIPSADTWHFSQSCSLWPSGDYLELDLPPIVGEICNECKTIRGKLGEH
jgi:hypothetical protein